jgi:hypothetical protein
MRTCRWKIVLLSCPRPRISVLGQKRASQEDRRDHRRSVQLQGRLKWWQNDWGEADSR